ncbi:hypothetical protein AAFF_G00361450 [Aldrovandia affinis]|uniref:Reverse transcriptase domain-containing protein n=1 Tax=Aldrovandia affinis TaxID=143900 RepID=A0AAD7SJV9_9TELE|nr:hypothetical protein AAFF_G00361450 [Aldrovandia affinis]
MTATIVGNSGSETAPFRVDTGVKQGCIIAPTLFAIFIAAILHLTSQNLPEGVKLVYRNVDHYAYLGSLLSTRAVIDAEIHHHIGCASGAFARLRKRVFEDRDIQTKTKLLAYQAVVLPSLLYGAESWTTYSRHMQALEQYHQ